MGIKRRLLDAAVLEQARAEGADVCLGITALDLLASETGFRGVRTDHGDFDAKAIVLADGLRSRLRRIAGMDVATGVRRYGVSAHFCLQQQVEPCVCIRLRHDHEVYLTPVGPRETNVAVLVGENRAKMLAGSVQQSFQDLVRCSGMLPESAELLDGPMVAGPFPARARRLWKDNLVLAGDAGGFFDGISGEGMSLAIVSSKMAAKAVAAYLKDGSHKHFRAYANSRHRLERNSTLLARATLLLASHGRLGRYAIGNLRKRPATFEKLLAINAGAAGLQSLRPRDFSCLFLGV
jgi:flavin-dependent dehydrogenase